jgi:hypothetical protein
VVHTCVVTWQQLQVLDVGQDIHWADLQVLASLPHLHTLTCSGIKFGRAGQACLSALRSLSFSGGFHTWFTSPAQLVALSLPSLESIMGKLCVQLRFNEAEDQDQMLRDLRQAAAGILQWAHEVVVSLDDTPDTLVRILQALASWRPVQRGHVARLILYSPALNTTPARVAALSHVPDAVQHLS